LLGSLASCFEDVPELAADLTAAKELRLHGGCCPEIARRTPTRGTRRCG
jgi:hypothetical protein